MVLEAHAPTTPKFPSGSICEIAGNYVHKWMLAHHFCILLQLKMPTDGVKMGRWNQPFTLVIVGDGYGGGGSGGGGCMYGAYLCNMI